MSGRKVCCIITLIMLCLLVVNFFLPLASDGEISISFYDILVRPDYGEGSSIIIFPVLIYFSFLILGIVNCILCLCNVTKDYKYALSSISIPLLIYILLFVSYLVTGGEYISIGCILGPILSIASLVLIFVGNGIGNKNNTNNALNNYQNNNFGAQIKGYDPMTGKPIYATFKGYNTQTGEPIFD